MVRTVKNILKLLKNVKQFLNEILQKA